MYKYATKEQLENLAKLQKAAAAAVLSFQKRDKYNALLSDYIQAISVNDLVRNLGIYELWTATFPDPETAEKFLGRANSWQSRIYLNRFLIFWFSQNNQAVKQAFENNYFGAVFGFSQGELAELVTAYKFIYPLTKDAGGFQVKLKEAQKAADKQAFDDVSTTRKALQDFEKILFEQDKEKALNQAQIEQQQAAAQFQQTLTQTFNSPARVLGLFAGIGLLAFILIISISKIIK